MNKKYIKYISVITLIIIISFVLKVDIGRSIPNPYEENKKETENKNDINILYSFSDLSGSISLGKQNLITGAYAKRTLFVVEINQQIQDISKLKKTKLYLNKDIIQNDNFFYQLNNKTFGIFVIDNAYSIKEIEAMKVVNEDLIKNGVFNEEMSMKHKPAKIVTKGLIEVNDIFNYKNVDYLRLPNEASDAVTFLPLQKTKDAKYLEDDNLEVFNIDTNTSLQSEAKGNVFEIDMSKYISRSSLSLIKASFFNDVEIDKVGIKLIDSELFIPLNDNIVRSK